MAEPCSRVAAKGPGVLPSLRYFGYDVPVTNMGISDDESTEGATVGPSTPGAVPRASPDCPDSCSERWPGTGEAEGRGGFSRRCRRLPDRRRRGAEPSRGGAFVTAGALGQSPPPSVGGCPGDRLDEAEPPAGGMSGGLVRLCSKMAVGKMPNTRWGA